MLSFKINSHYSIPQYVYLLGSPKPVQMLPRRLVSTTVEFGNGLSFLVSDDIWWYQPDGIEYDIYRYHGIEMSQPHIKFYNPNTGYTIDEILDKASEALSETIIFNIDIFRRIE